MPHYLNSLSNLPKNQPVEGKTAIILTDITAAGLSPAAADTFRFLLGQRVGAIVAVLSRRTISDSVCSSQQVHHTYCSAVAATLQSSTPEDLQKISVTSAASIGADVFSNGCVGDNIIFVNDTFAGHPAAKSFLANWNGAVQEVQGFAFGEHHTAIWPLAKKTVLIITDASSDFEAQLSLQTIRDVISQGTASVHVTVTSLAQSNAAKIIAEAFKVEVESQPPVRADSPLWKKPISVSFLSSSQKAASVTAFNNAFVTAHAFVNDTASENAHDVLASIAFGNIRHQAVGFLRRTALVAGDLSGASFKCQRGEEVVAKVWPVKTKRFGFLVDGSIIFSDNKSSSASSIATFLGISRVLKQGGNVLLIPASVPSTTPVSKQEQDATAHAIIEILQNNFGITPSEVVTFTGEDFIHRHLGRTSSIFIAFTNAASIHENILKSCDVFVRDTSSDEKISVSAETLLNAARTTFTQIAVGNSTSNLSNAGTSSSSASTTSILASSSSNVSIFTSIISKITGSSHSIPCITSLGCSSKSSSTESQDMRKPIQGGEGSLLSNVVASTATTILLHPLNLLINPVPNPNHLPLPFLPLRVIHSIAREFIFHGLTKTQFGKQNSNKPLLPGCLASVAAGVASEPFRAVAYGAAGSKPSLISASSFYSSIGDPFTVLSSIAMNLAPQSSFKLARCLDDAIQKYLPKTAAVARTFKTQVSFILNAVARIIICFFLTRVVLARSRYPAVGGILLVGGPNGRSTNCVMGLYMLREVLALVIETFVQKYFK